MYWTTYSGYSAIVRSELDGTNPVTLVTGLGDIFGIAIDFSSQRLYWADRYFQMIRSSDLEGHGVQTVYQLEHRPGPLGVAVVGNRVYWSTWGSHKLQSGSKLGGDHHALQPHEQDAPLFCRAKQ